MNKLLIIQISAFVILGLIIMPAYASPLFQYHSKTPKDGTTIGDTINFDFTINDRSTAGSGTGNITIDGSEITTFSCGSQPGLSFQCHYTIPVYAPQVTAGNHIITISLTDTLSNFFTTSINVTK